MTLKSYVQYHIGYCNGDLQKNVACVEVVDYGDRNAIVQRYNIARPNFPAGQNLFDGFITIYAENDKALKDILQEIFDTPVKVNGAAANLDPNPLGD